MRRLRIYFTSIAGGLTGAITVLAISSRIEQHRTEEFLERIRHTPAPINPAHDGPYGYVMGSGLDLGPGMVTCYLVVLVFASVFYLLFRWQDR
jgi:hypothetical protein